MTITSPPDTLMWEARAQAGRQADLLSHTEQTMLPTVLADPACLDAGIRICERQGVPILADRTYTGAGPWVTAPLRRPPGRGLTPTQQCVNRALSAARAPVERGVG